MKAIESRRAALREAAPDAPRPLRIFTFGRYTFGATDVVACLVRALRNLGHHVTHFDTDQFRDLVDDRDHPTPDNVHGGAAPRWLNLQALASAFRQERPQVVLLLAGGLMVREDEARWLRSQGAILAGLTLSDPDVFTSVARHAMPFDVHATNARQSLEDYRSAGVENTLWFPFGIDLSFVATSLATDPALRADVICLGHAQGREERNRTMQAVASRLGSRYTVRTYGRGWQLPGSVVVAGTRMIQASRAGRIHVNFPGTRAGYTNVKCGVFESIANGGLIVTQRFEEMESFFEPGVEIACYDTLDQIPELLESLLTEPERIDAIAQAGFERLVREHSYEQRWNRYFADLEAAAVRGGLGLTSQRRAQVIEILERPAVRPSRPVIVSGFYGANNLGDEAILQSIARNLRARDASIECTVVATNAQRVIRRHGLEALDRAKLNRCDDALRSAEAFVLGGGGLWHDHSFERAGGLRSLFTNGAVSIGGYSNLGVLASLRSVPFHLLGMGVGPLTDPEARRLAAYVLRHVNRAVVRDRESAGLLREIASTPSSVEEGVDCVYALPLPTAQPRPDTSRIVVGLNLRHWSSAEVMKRIAATVADALNQLARRSERGVKVVALPMQEGKSFDREVIRWVVDRLDFDPALELAPSQGDFDAAIAAFGAPDIVLAMRLHASLLAHRFRIPAVGLDYDDKVRRHFDEVGRSVNVLNLHTDADTLYAALSKALEHGLAPATLDSLQRLEQRATQMFDSFVEGLIRRRDRRLLHAFPSVAARNDDVDNAIAFARRSAQSA